MKFDENQTIGQRLLFERRAIKKFKKDHDGKIRMNPKHDQKAKLNGQSPDCFDALCQLWPLANRPKPKSHEIFLSV